MKGQASVEMLMVAAAVLAILATLLARGVESNEASNILAAARIGANEAIDNLALEYDVNINVMDCEREGDSIVIYLSIQGSPPPSDDEIENVVAGAALYQIRRVGGPYDVCVMVERVVR